MSRSYSPIQNSAQKKLEITFDLNKGIYEISPIIKAKMERYYY